MKSPRRLYVTHEEFEKLQKLAHDEKVRGVLHAALPFKIRPMEADDEAFLAEVSGLVGVDVETLRRHTWHVEVVEGDKVERRVGQSWNPRGGPGRPR